MAKFEFRYIKKGIYLGRHLISLVYGSIIKDYKPDIIIAHEHGINTLFSLFLKCFFDYKLFVTIDDSPEIARSYGTLRNILRNFVVRYVDCMLVVHPDVKIYLETKFAVKSKCKYLYFPIIQNEAVLLPKIRKAKTKANELLTIYELENKSVFLFVGRLEPQKAPDLLLQAFMKIADQNKILVFVGKGSMSKFLKAEVESNNLSSCVLFTGQLTGDELYAWYRLADTFVLPSRSEPFGAVVNEALVAGCNVIVSDKVGANSLIRESINGTIYQHDNLNDLVGKLLVYSKIVKSKINDEEPNNSMPFSFQVPFSQFEDLVNFL